MPKALVRFHACFMPVSLWTFLKRLVILVMRAIHVFGLCDINLLARLFRSAGSLLIKVYTSTSMEGLINVHTDIGVHVCTDTGKLCVFCTTSKNVFTLFPVNMYT